MCERGGVVTSKVRLSCCRDQMGCDQKYFNKLRNLTHSLKMIALFRPLATSSRKFGMSFMHLPIRSAATIAVSLDNILKSFRKAPDETCAFIEMLW